MKDNFNLTMPQLNQKVAALCSKYLKYDEIDRIKCYFHKTWVRLDVTYTNNDEDGVFIIESAFDIMKIEEKIKMKLKEV